MRSMRFVWLCGHIARNRTKPHEPHKTREPIEKYIGGTTILRGETNNCVIPPIPDECCRTLVRQATEGPRVSADPVVLDTFTYFFCCFGSDWDNFNEVSDRVYDHTGLKLEFAATKFNYPTANCIAMYFLPRCCCSILQGQIALVLTSFSGKSHTSWPYFK